MAGKVITRSSHLAHRKSCTYATVHTLALKLGNKITQKYFQIFIMGAREQLCECASVGLIIIISHVAVLTPFASPLVKIKEKSKNKK